MKYSLYTAIIILLSSLHNYSTIETSHKTLQNKNAVVRTSIVKTIEINKPFYLNATSIDTRQQEGPYKPAWFMNIEPKLASLDKELIELKHFEANIAKQEILEDNEIAQIEATFEKLHVRSNISSRVISEPDYWTTLYSVETKQGSRLYRPRNKYKNCSTTSSPCGHHQLSVQALKDIGCTSKQCKKDREDFAKSLFMSKQLQAVNTMRLNKAGFSDLPEYQQYLVHQQGASGIKRIIAAVKGKKKLSNKIKHNMANNSPYSFASLRKMSSKQAAKKFLQHWKQKWDDEKDLIRVSQLNLKTHKLLNEYELNIALNLNLRY